MYVIEIDDGLSLPQTTAGAQGYEIVQRWEMRLDQIHEYLNDGRLIDVWAMAGALMRAIESFECESDPMIIVDLLLCILQ